MGRRDGVDATIRRQFMRSWAAATMMRSGKPGPGGTPDHTAHATKPAGVDVIMDPGETDTCDGGPAASNVAHLPAKVAIGELSESISTSA